MVARQSLICFVFLYVCSLSPVISQNVLSWPYYEGFASDWILKEGSTAVKTATSPSAISDSLAYLDGVRNEHDGDVWGLWDYGTESGTLSYKFNLTEYGSFFCGITSARLRIKYFSEGENEGRILHCTEPSTVNSDETVDDPCGLPATDSTENFANVLKPVLISDKILEFEFTTQEGKIVIIDEVAMIYNVNPNDPTCQEPEPEPEEETNQQEQPQPGRGKLEQILNQFKQDFKQFFSFLKIFG